MCDHSSCFLHQAPGLLSSRRADICRIHPQEYPKALLSVGSKPRRRLSEVYSIPIVDYLTKIHVDVPFSPPFVATVARFAARLDDAILHNRDFGFA